MILNVSVVNNVAKLSVLIILMHSYFTENTPTCIILRYAPFSSF